MTEKLSEYSTQAENLATECKQLEASNAALKLESENQLKSGNDELSKLLSEKDETINNILLEKEKLTTELGEKLSAEVTGREAAVKSKEKIEAKYEDLKQSNNETKEKVDQYFDFQISELTSRRSVFILNF